VRHDRPIRDEQRFAASLADAIPAARRVATVVLGRVDGADDVVQVALERAWRGQRTYDESRPVRPWFLRIVANTARNDRRSSGRRAALERRVALGEDTPSAGTPEDDAVAAGDRALVLAALNRLSGPDREVLALRYVVQLAEADVAVVLDVPVGTVKSRLSRAKGRLRDELAALDRGTAPAEGAAP